MRIIAGTKRGMKLISPEGDVSRPITDRVKESLFSMLYKYDLPAGKMVADVFAGVGSMGLESLSRDAEFVTFVEKDPKIAAILNKNIAKAGFADRSKVLQSDAFRIGAAVSKGRYDLVFVDPPYPLTKDTGPDSQLSHLLSLLPDQTNAGAIIVVRTRKGISLPGPYQKLDIIDTRHWGTMAITILWRKPDDQ
ncbi:RsmD family RNA methyltransferase [Planctomycetota bacterium]